MGLAAHAQDQHNAWTVGVENDLLAGSQKDADYTGGFSFTMTGSNASSATLSMDSVLGAIDSLWLPAGGRAPSTKAGLHLGLQAWTPLDKQSSTPIRDERPYASLVSLTSTRMLAGADNEPAWATSLTLGILGAGFADGIHSGVHKLVGSGPGPKGYDHQISQGGEPTVMYALRRQSLLAQSNSGNTRYDIKWGVEGSLGYLTEAALSVSGRVGRVNSPWWSLQGERVEFYAPRVTDGELFLSYGLTARVRGYNALLEGQFRDSTVTVPRSNLEKLIGTVWLGVTWGISSSSTLSYQMRHQSAEIKSGPAARSYSTGGLYFTSRY